MQKQLIFNDPVYGLITVPHGIIFELLQHPYLQRLRRIKQLSLTSLVFPGATHTRFDHALGAFYLMTMALDTLRSKGHEVSPEEYEGAQAAILLHDIGHGPFSHTLEHTVIKGVAHEKMSLLIMERLNVAFGGRLGKALEIFSGTYPKKFLCGLVSGQLDVDRMDYLNRDSFYTGVQEGVIGYDRIIRMLEVQGGELVVEAKGIHSLEKFLVARMIMYWQVYLHKTVLAAEQMLIRILLRARHLAKGGEELFATSPLNFFIRNDLSYADFHASGEAFEQYTGLDDYDIIACAKEWTRHKDKVLSMLCKRLINRDLFKIIIQDEPVPADVLYAMRRQASEHFGISAGDASYFVFSDILTESAYSHSDPRIGILSKDGSVKDFSEAAEHLNMPLLSKPLKKHYICFPKEVMRHFH